MDTPDLCDDMSDDVAERRAREREWNDTVQHFEKTLEQVDVTSLSDSDLKDMVSGTKERLAELRSLAVEAEQLLASDPLNWKAWQGEIYEQCKVRLQFEERLLAGLEYIVTSRKYGFPLN